MQEKKSILAKVVLDLLEGIEYTKYTNLEDDDLIGYISQHDGYKHDRTQGLWKMMETKCLPCKGTLLTVMCMKLILVQLRLVAVVT